MKTLMIMQDDDGSFMVGPDEASLEPVESLDDAMAMVSQTFGAEPAEEPARPQAMLGDEEEQAAMP